MDETDQTRNAGISNALPCPLQQNFHSNHLSQPSGYGPMNSLPNVNGPRNNHSSQNQDSVRYNLWDRCGYELWWSLKVRTMWRFDSSLSRSIQVFKIWSSLAGAFRVSYLLAEGTPSICDDVFVNCHLWVGCHQRCVFVQSSWEIELQNCRHYQPFLTECTWHKSFLRTNMLIARLEAAYWLVTAAFSTRLFLVYEL